MPETATTLSPDDALKFVQSQMSRMRAEVDGKEYPEMTFRELIPINDHTDDEDGGESSEEVEMEREGDRPVAMAGVGFDFDVREITDYLTQNIPLTSDKAMASRYAALEFLQRLAFEGDADKGWNGLINQESRTLDSENGILADPAAAPDYWEPGSRLWKNKTGSRIMDDINSALTMPNRNTKKVFAIADTLLLPIEAYTLLAITPFENNSAQSVLSVAQSHNIYTMTTGKPLTLRVVRGLETAATSTVGDGGRMVAYWNHPDVLQFHLPKPHQFSEPELFPERADEDDEDYQFMGVQVRGYFSTAGLEIMKPDCVHYVDGIT